MLEPRLRDHKSCLSSQSSRNKSPGLILGACDCKPGNVRHISGPSLQHTLYLYLSQTLRAAASLPNLLL